MRRLLWLVAGLFTLVGCKTTATTSEVREDAAPAAVDCPCSDLQCWRTKSNAAAVQQLECAKDALSAAATLSTGGLANATLIASGLVDVGIGLANQNVYQLLAGAGNGGAAVTDAFGSEGAPVVSCVKAAATVVGQVSDTINTLKNYKPEGAEALTDIVKAISHGMDANHNFANSMLQCMATVSETTDNQALKDFGTFMKGWTKVLANVDAAIAVVTCGAKITNGGMVLIQNTQCLAQDLKNLEDSRKRVAAALAFNGSRAFNHARYTGCGCVQTHWWQSARTELANCQACCDGEAPSVMHDDEPTKRSLWNGECKLSCNVAFTQGIFWDYMDTRNCSDVKSAAASTPTRILYRYMDLTDDSSPSPLLRQIQETRAALLDALAQVKSGFDQVDNACPSQQTADGTISKEKLACCASSASGALKDACTLLGKDKWWSLLDTADVATADDRAGPSAVDALVEEVTRYQSETEAAFPAPIDPTTGVPQTTVLDRTASLTEFQADDRCSNTGGLRLPREGDLAHINWADPNIPDGIDFHVSGYKLVRKVQGDGGAWTYRVSNADLGGKAATLCVADLGG